MPQYTSRDVGDPSQIKKTKQSMADLKLRRLTELNSRLREDLERERIPVSQAAKSIIAYCNSTRDYMVPSVWGPVPKGEDPYAPQQSGGCCLVMAETRRDLEYSRGQGGEEDRSGRDDGTASYDNATTHTLSFSGRIAGWLRVSSACNTLVSLFSLFVSDVCSKL
ncbi:hypothetical protein VTH06DRAFT_3850 [Thermothelomyces fergusii]